jgi:hypothetical protein
MALMQSVTEVNSSAEHGSDGDSLVDSRFLSIQDLAASQRRESGSAAVRRDPGLSRMLFGSEVHAASAFGESGASAMVCRSRFVGHPSLLPEPKGLAGPRELREFPVVQDDGSLPASSPRDIDSLDSSLHESPLRRSVQQQQRIMDQVLVESAALKADREQLINGMTSYICGSLRIWFIP